MTNDLSMSLLVVTSILLGLAALLFLMAAIDPQTEPVRARQK